MHRSSLGAASQYRYDVDDGSSFQAATELDKRVQLAVDENATSHGINDTIDDEHLRATIQTDSTK